MILDSCAIQSTPTSGERAGYDGAKRRNGSKVLFVVDTLGELLALVVTPASDQDRAGRAIGRRSASGDRRNGRVGLCGRELYRRCAFRSRPSARHPVARRQARLCAAAVTLGHPTRFRLGRPLPPLGPRLRTVGHDVRTVGHDVGRVSYPRFLVFDAVSLHSHKIESLTVTKRIGTSCEGPRGERKDGRQIGCEGAP